MYANQSTNMDVSMIPLKHSEEEILTLSDGSLPTDQSFIHRFPVLYIF